jgi:hypothetical protein
MYMGECEIAESLPAVCVSAPESPHAPEACVGAAAVFHGAYLLYHMAPPLVSPEVMFHPLLPKI